MIGLRRLPIAALVGVAAVAAAPSGALGATIGVTTTADEFGPGSSCSLREAVSAANDDAAFGGCPAGGPEDTIKLPPGTYRLTRTGAELGPVVGFNDLDLLAPVTVANTGPGQAIIDGSGTDRVLTASSAAPGIGLVGLTIRNGAAGGSGGGIADAGTVLTIRNSTFEGNHAEGEGGAIYATDNGAAITLENVTLSANRANESGGAFSSEGGMHTIRNSTITGNVADDDAAGGATQGGGIFANVGGTTIRDTIVAGNTDRTPTPMSGDCTGQGLGSLGNNLVGDPQGCDFFGPHPSSDLLGADPKLGTLADNGGPTPTHALLAGSEALGKASGTAPPADQRGAPRAGAGDIGAYERVTCAGLVVNRVGSAGRDRLEATRRPGRDPRA